MPKYQYKTLYCDFVANGHYACVLKDDDRYIAEHNPLGGVKNAPELHTYLNQLAAEGWRVINTLSGGEHRGPHLLIMERATS